MAENNTRAWHAVLTKGSAALKKRLTLKHGDKPEFQRLLKSTGQDKETWYKMHLKKQARLRGEDPTTKEKERKEIGLKAWGATKGTRMGGEEGGGLTTDAPKAGKAVVGQHAGAGPVKTLSVAEYMKQKEEEQRREKAKAILAARTKMNEQTFHRIGVTVSDDSVKSGDKILKMITVPGADEAEAQKNAAKKMRKYGFTVHDTYHHSTITRVKEETEQMDEGITKAINKKMKNTLSAISGRKALGAPDKDLSWQQNKAKAIKAGRAAQTDPGDKLQTPHHIGVTSGSSTSGPRLGTDTRSVHQNRNVVKKGDRAGKINKGAIDSLKRRIRSRMTEEAEQMDETASVSVTIQGAAPANKKYAVTEIHPRKSPRGRTRWKDVSYHSSEEEAKAAADAHAKKNNLHRMKSIVAEEFEQMDESTVAALDAIRQFASRAHEDWRKTLPAEERDKPRMRSKNGGPMADINVPFHKLHPSAQKENLDAGKAAFRAVVNHGSDTEAAAEHVHREWMKRNPKSDYNAHQHVPYHELPEDEKQKDRDHVITMRSILSSKRKTKMEEGTVDLTKTLIKKIKAKGDTAYRSKKTGLLTLRKKSMKEEYADYIRDYGRSRRGRARAMAQHQADQKRSRGYQGYHTQIHVDGQHYKAGDRIGMGERGAQEAAKHAVNIAKKTGKQVSIHMVHHETGKKLAIADYKDGNWKYRNMNEGYKEDLRDAPFDTTGARKVKKTYKDKYGNVVKNIAKHLAKKGMAAAMKKEEANSILERAKWRSSSAAERDDDNDWDRSPRSTGGLRATSDTRGNTGGEYDHHSLENRRKAQVVAKTGKTTKASNTSLKNRIRSNIADLKNQRTYGANLPEEAEQVDKELQVGQKVHVSGITGKHTGVIKKIRSASDGNQYFVKHDDSAILKSYPRHKISVKEEVEQMDEKLEREGPVRPDLDKMFARLPLGKVAQAYAAKKAAERDAMNKANDPGADRKGLALSVTDTVKAIKKGYKRGVDNPVKQSLVGKKGFNEDVEQIDELKRDTLISYVDKARAKNIKDSAKNRLAGMETSLSNMDKASAKTSKRSKGIGRAYARLNMKEALDKVGRETADIDNDKDVDKTDMYLHNRRGAIKKAIAKKKLNEGKAAAAADKAIALQRGKGNKINRKPTMEVDMKAQASPEPTHDGEDDSANVKV